MEAQLGAISLARSETYQITLKNCRDGLVIRTECGCPKERLSGALQAGALDDGLEVSIWWE